MDIDLTLGDLDPGAAQSAASALDNTLAATLWATEAKHDPFVSLTAAALATKRIRIGTSVAVAFARSPVQLAYTANDLQLAANGRFVLGLGTQVEAHIRRRYSMPWSDPVERMAEYIKVVRGTWGAWNGKGPSQFHGKHYTTDLMPPAFSPRPNPHGAPPILLAAVGPRMVELALESADGMLLHPISTPTYLEKSVAPFVDRSRGQCLVASTLVATGPTDEAMWKAFEATRRQIAFYASTRAYLPILRHHGLDDIQAPLAALIRSGLWNEIPNLVTDSAVETLAIVAAPADVASAIRDRWGSLVSSVALSTAYRLDPQLYKTILGVQR